MCPGELWSYEVTLMDSKMSDEDFTFYMEFATPFILRSITSNVSETEDLEIEFWIELVPYKDFTNTSVNVPIKCINCIEDGIFFFI